MSDTENNPHSNNGATIEQRVAALEAKIRSMEPKKSSYLISKRTASTGVKFPPNVEITGLKPDNWMPPVVKREEGVIDLGDMQLKKEEGTDPVVVRFNETLGKVTKSKTGKPVSFTLTSESDRYKISSAVTMSRREILGMMGVTDQEARDPKLVSISEDQKIITVSSELLSNASKRPRQASTTAVAKS